MELPSAFRALAFPNHQAKTWCSDSRLERPGGHTQDRTDRGPDRSEGRARTSGSTHTDHRSPRVHEGRQAADPSDRQRCEARTARWFESTTSSAVIVLIVGHSSGDSSLARSCSLVVCLRTRLRLPRLRLRPLHHPRLRHHRRRHPRLRPRYHPHLHHPRLCL